MVGSTLQAGSSTAKAARQLFGGAPPGPRSRHTYQSRFGLSLLDAALDEPRVLDGRVVRHPVEHDPDAPGVAVGDEPVELVQVAEDRVDVAVVGHVVAEVGHRRTEDRREPDGVDAEPREMVEAVPDAPEIAHPVGVAIREAPGIDLIDH